MRRMRLIEWMLLIAVLLTLGMILLRCSSDDEGVTVEPSPTPGPLPTMPPFVPGQVIITGIKSRVEKVVTDTLGWNEKEQRLGRINLQEAGINPLACNEILTAVDLLDSCLRNIDRSERDKPWVIDLYRLSGTSTVADIVNRVMVPDDIACVYAHPNYITGRPWTGFGSPWTGFGSPLPGSGASPTDRSAFEGQWAFIQIGLTNTITSTWNDVPLQRHARIGIFDTSPFTLVVESESEQRFINWATSPFSLTVWHPEILAQLPAPTTTPEVNLDPTNHGLFVAGLAQRVAPYSDIHLYRVLDEYVRGDLFTLDVALRDFIAGTPEHIDGRKRAVINLSLGVLPPKDISDFELPPEVMALELLLTGARCQGMAVIAAAGNDREFGEPAPRANIPARYPYVLGVAASNNVGRAACFSNAGDIAAPGGEGTGDRECKPCTPENCEKLSVISLVLEPPGYAYWAGTSFATPLVSGQAALLFECLQDPFPPTAMGHHDVILNSANSTSGTGTDPVLGNGIIHLSAIIQ